MVDLVGIEPTPEGLGNLRIVLCAIGLEWWTKGDSNPYQLACKASIIPLYDLPV